MKPLFSCLWPTQACRTTYADNTREEGSQTVRERLENDSGEAHTLRRLEPRRDREEEPDEFRTCHQRDRDRITLQSFRRLEHKTQVFLSPEGDHYRTRLTHTLEVAQIARTISRALRLNEDLTEAIALA